MTRFVLLTTCINLFVWNDTDYKKHAMQRYFTYQIDQIYLLDA
jgi:hypothetical protein